MSEILKLNNNFNNNIKINDTNQYSTNITIKNNVDEKNASGIKQKKTNKPEECETCKNRKYQDGSNDPGVSFKSPRNLMPGEAASAVYSHEREHYTREEAKAAREGGEVVKNTITVHTSICPECGKAYISGGETRTLTKRKAEEKLEFAKEFYDNTVGKHRAREIDAQV